MASNPPSAAQPRIDKPARSPMIKGVHRATAARRPLNQSIWRARERKRALGRVEDSAKVVMLLTFCAESMAEVPDSGEDHGQTKTIGGGDYFVIFYGTARLNNRCCAGGG